MGNFAHFIKETFTYAAWLVLGMLLVCLYFEGEGRE